MICITRVNWEIIYHSIRTITSGPRNLVIPTGGCFADTLRMLNHLWEPTTRLSVFVSNEVAILRYWCRLIRNLYFFFPTCRYLHFGAWLAKFFYTCWISPKMRYSTFFYSKIHLPCPRPLHQFLKISLIQWTVLPLFGLHFQISWRRQIFKILLVSPVSRSLMYRMKKRVGPMMESWGTPLVTLSQLNVTRFLSASLSSVHACTVPYFLCCVI